jgi:hypothetical protein
MEWWHKKISPDAEIVHYVASTTTVIHFFAALESDAK